MLDCLKGKDSVLVYDDECRSLVESKLRDLERFGGSIRCITDADSHSVQVDHVSMPMRSESLCLTIPSSE